MENASFALNIGEMSNNVQDRSSYYTTRGPLHHFDWVAFTYHGPACNRSIFINHTMCQS
jgi:hypothetical protein